LLGVDMPLFAFYGFAPSLFVVLHLYVLMQLKRLTGYLHGNLGWEAIMTLTQSGSVLPDG
jgi:hypothetical protein